MQSKYQHPLRTLGIGRAALAGMLLVISTGHSAETEPLLAWQAGVADWSDAQTLPERWEFEGPGELRVESRGADTSAGSVIVVPNFEGELSTLKIPGPAGFRYHDYVVEIRIGADSIAPGSGLNWFLKKRNLELRASNRQIVLFDPNSREQLPIGEFRVGEIQVIRIAFAVSEGTIRSLTVDGDEVPAAVGYPVAALAEPGVFFLYGPTQSGGEILLESIQYFADGEALANLPRWKRPERAEEDMGLPPTLPTWEPVAGAEELEFKIDPERLKSPPFDRGILFSLEDFANLEQVLAADPAMARFWDGLISRARELLASGNTGLPEDEAARLTYVIRFIAPLALLHAATGEEHLGALLKQIIVDLIERPMAFWVHSDLRRYEPDWPTGQLETAELARSVALAAIWSRDLFSDAEYAHVLAMLEKKGLDPSLRWIEGRGMQQKNNYLAVIGSGALIAAIVLEDAEAEVESIRALERWLALIEDDGSYGEPQGYFEYGCSRFFFGWWALGHERAREMLKDSPLRKSLDWMVYYFILAEHQGTTSAWRVNFGDDDFLTGPRGRTTFENLVSESLAYAYDDGLGTWIAKNLIHQDAPLSLFSFTFRLSVQDGGLPEPVSPEEKGLPLAQNFDNGVAVIRSSWDFHDATVFALRSGGASRTEYAHDRPNRNAFVLFARGDYLAVAPGRASYRSPLHRGWDIPTTSQNTIAIDGENQKRDRVAEVVAFVDEPEFVKIASQARESYQGDPQSMLRTVWYLKKHDLFVIEDEVRLGAERMPTWHMLLSNFEGTGTLSETDSGGWVLQRPRANLAFDVAADVPLELTEAAGYMHSGYSYFPGDPFEGTEGSGISLTWRPLSPVQDVRFYSILRPGGGKSRADVRLISKTGESPVWNVTSGERVVTVRLESDGDDTSRIVAEEGTPSTEE